MKTKWGKYVTLIKFPHHVACLQGYNLPYLLEYLPLFTMNIISSMLLKIIFFCRAIVQIAEANRKYVPFASIKR